MRRIVPLILSLLVLAGCEEAAAPPSPTGTTARLRAGFPPHGVADTIEVDAVERLPLRAAALVAPDGTAAPASYLNVADSPTFATGQWAAGNLWHNAVPGDNAIPALAIHNAQAGAALRGRTELLAIVSTADLPLPDPVAYRRDWQHYHIRLSFGTPPGEVETRDLPAPAPPPVPPQHP